MHPDAPTKTPDEPLLLVVDDDDGIRDLLSRYLAQEGFRVVAVEDGRAMDDWLADNTPDLVILDLMLPGEDGLSVARRLTAGRSGAAHHHDLGARRGHRPYRRAGGRRRRLSGKAF